MGTAMVRLQATRLHALQQCMPSKELVHAGKKPYESWIPCDRLEQVQQQVRAAAVRGCPGELLGLLILCPSAGPEMQWAIPCGWHSPRLRNGEILRQADGAVCLAQATALPVHAVLPHVSASIRKREAAGRVEESQSTLQVAPTARTRHAAGQHHVTYHCRLL